MTTGPEQLSLPTKGSITSQDSFLLVYFRVAGRVGHQGLDISLEKFYVQISIALVLVVDIHQVTQISDKDALEGSRVKAAAIVGVANLRQNSAENKN